jgi:hypothetical protein
MGPVHRSIRRPFPRVLALATGLALAATACGGGDDDGASSPTGTDIDVGFLQALADLDVQFGEVADIVLARTDDPELTAALEDVSAQVETELAEIDALLAGLGAGRGAADRDPMAWMNMAGSPLIGLVTPDGLVAITETPPPLGDRLGVQGLVGLRQGADHLAETAVVVATEEGVRGKAFEVQTDQEAQILTLGQQLDRLSAGEAMVTSTTA